MSNLRFAMSIEIDNHENRDFGSICPICNADPEDLHCQICYCDLSGDSKNLRICKDCLLESFKVNDYVFQCPHCKKPLEIVSFIDMLSLMDIENIFSAISKRLFDDIMFTNLSTKNNGATLYNILTIDCNYILENIDSIYRIYLMTLIESPRIPHVSRSTFRFKSENFDYWWDAIKDRNETECEDYSTKELEEEVLKYKNSKKKSLLKLPFKKSIESLKLKPYFIYQCMNLVAKNRHVSIKDIETTKKAIMEEHVWSSRDEVTCDRLLFKCSTDCGGFVMGDYTCNLCNANYCRKCGLILDETHTPELCKSNSSSFKYILSTTQACPKCAIRINKSEGCDVMFCTFCHICFSYNTGKELKGNLHNPHRLEWLKSLDKPATFNENENGVCIDVRNYTFDNLREDYWLRGRMLLFQDIINELEDRINNSNLYRAIRNYINYKMLPRYKLSKSDLIEIADTVFLSMRMNDIHDRLRTLIDTIVDYMQYYSQITELEDKDTLLMRDLNKFIETYVFELIDLIKKLKLPCSSFESITRFSDKCERYMNKTEYRRLYITLDFSSVTKGRLMFKRICGEDSPYNIVLNTDPVDSDFPIEFSHNKRMIDSTESINRFGRPNIESIKTTEKFDLKIDLKGCIPQTFEPTFCIRDIPCGLEPIDPFKNGFNDESFEIYRSNDLWVGSLLNYIFMEIYFGRPSNLPKLSLIKDINSYALIQKNRAFDIDINEKESPHAFISPFRFYINRPVLSNYSRLSMDIAHVFGCCYKNIDDLKKMKYLTFGVFNYIRFTTSTAY